VSAARFIVGDVFDVMAEMEDGSVDLVLTSPPFLALRSYLPADHPDKAKEIGSEPTPAAFIDTLLALTAEWRRLLAPHGSICVELGDTYSGSGGAGGDYAEGGMRDGQPVFRQKVPARRTERANGSRYNRDEGHAVANLGGQGWPLAKSLCLIPELYRIGLVYGLNPLTGEPSPAGQFRARNVVRWCRPNPPVGALGDKFRPATSEMVVACVSGSRWFDLDSVREPASPNTNPRTAKGVAERPNDCKTSPDGNRDSLAIQHSHETVPPLDWWKISTQPYAGSHYATWPAELCKRPILSMCPPGGTVLDPFAGSGTTLAVATGHGRDAIGIDIDSRNAALAQERVGMFLTVDEPLASGCGGTPDG
jgi:DNA modification methylase